MKRERKLRRLRPGASLPAAFRLHPNAIVLVVLACVSLFSACSNSSKSSENSGALSGNWQFQLTTDGSFASLASPNCSAVQGGTLFCLGGFLVQRGGAVNGQAQYSITIPSPPPDKPFCNSGSAQITGTVNGQNVTLTALAGAETFTLTGTLSSDGSTMTGTYTSNDAGCGNAQTGAQWSASTIPPLSGRFQGSFHSTGTGSDSALVNQEFPVTGVFTQGPNTGSSSASVTGTLNFQGYPCLSTASVNGEVSGSSVILEIIAPNGLTVGQIGGLPGASNPQPVSFTSALGGNVVRGSNGYGVTTKGCKGGNVQGDIGNICLSLGATNVCTEPVSLTPASLTFPPELLGSSPTSQSFTLMNSDPSGAALNLQLAFPGARSTPSDFNGTPHFQEQDNCAASLGSSFTLTSQQSCTITVVFSPQQSCPWLPSVSLGGEAPSSCPPFLPASVSSPPSLSAQVTVSCLNCSTSADSNLNFSASVSGVGVSAIQPSTPELDFGAEQATDMSGTGGEASVPQSVSFINQGFSSIQILPAVRAGCGAIPGRSAALRPRPATAGTVPGFQVVTNSISLVGNSTPPPPNTVQYICDVDQSTAKANFQITSDNCSGTVLVPQQSCSISITYAPQVGESNGGLDYFLELNTTECTSTVTTNCEIDSGRFPVELRSNVGSPLRMSPGAGLDFGIQPRGQSTAPLTITLENDASVANPVTVNFTGNVLKGDYAETDNCGVSLSPGNSCTLNITFTPTVVGFDQGNITITYNGGQTQTVYMRGFGQ